MKYYNMKCRYLDYDGKVFREASINFTVVKFRGRKRISTFKAFPLQYYPDKDRVKAEFFGYGRKFISLLGAYHRYGRGAVFYMKEREVIKISVDSRIMLDTAFFRKMNPNYIRSQFDELVKKKVDDNDYFENFLESFKDQVKDNGVELTRIEEDDLLICYLIVPGFSLGDKLWRITVSLMVLWLSS